MNNLIISVLSGFVFFAGAATNRGSSLDGPQIRYVQQGHRGYREVHLLEKKGAFWLIDGVEIPEEFLPLVAQEVKILRKTEPDANVSCYGTSFELNIVRGRETVVERGCAGAKRSKAIADSFRRLQDLPFQEL